jgi:hypothetical protein
MDITISITDTDANAIQYCIDNKISPNGPSAIRKYTIPSTITGYIQFIVNKNIGGFTKIVNIKKNEELLTTVKSTPEILAQVQAIVDAKKSPIEEQIIP